MAVHQPIKDQHSPPLAKIVPDNSWNPNDYFVGWLISHKYKRKYPTDGSAVIPYDTCYVLYLTPFDSYTVINLTVGQLLFLPHTKSCHPHHGPSNIKMVCWR